MSCGGSRLFNRNAALIADLTAEFRGHITREVAAQHFHALSAASRDRLAEEFSATHGRRPNRGEGKDLTQQAHAEARNGLRQSLEREVADRQAADEREAAELRRRDQIIDGIGPIADYDSRDHIPDRTAPEAADRLHEALEAYRHRNGGTMRQDDVDAVVDHWRRSEADDRPRTDAEVEEAAAAQERLQAMTRQYLRDQGGRPLRVEDSEAIYDSWVRLENARTARVRR